MPPTDLEILCRIMGDISPPEEGDHSLSFEFLTDAAERLPLPYMVYLAMLLGTDCQFVFRPFEKTAWTVTFRFRGRPVHMAFGKFGMRVAAAAPEADRVSEEAIQVLGRAFPVVDRILQPLVDDQMRSGNVTVGNLHHVLRQRYEFFRTKAREAFDRPRGRDQLIPVPGEGGGKAVKLDLFRNAREGFYYGCAAMDAYFSWLEHVLVLVLPFTCYVPGVNDLGEFIASPWTSKMKRIWDLASDRRAKALYDSLRDIKERYRNPTQHGGFEKNGLSLHVHLPKVGAVPARLSRFTEGVHYDFFPLKDASFSDVCELFDRVDAYLRDGPTFYGMRFAESGLDVAFDAKSHQDYQEAMESEEQFGEMIDRLAYITDTNANMDW